MLERLRHWINGLRYCFTLWRLNRRVRQLKVNIDHLLAPALVESVRRFEMLAQTLQAIGLLDDDEPTAPR